MKHSHSQTSIRTGSKMVLKSIMLGMTLFIANISVASAAYITGNMGITGNYSFSGGTDLSDATAISLNTAMGTSGTDDIGTTVGFATFGTTPNGANISTSPFASTADIIEIGGWQFDMSSLSITDQTASLLTLSGNGVLSGNGLQNTNVTWTFSSQSASSYSMTITAAVVPVPAAAWLFGSGLLGLVAVSRRKSA